MGHAPLIAGQPELMFLEAIERATKTPIAHRGEPCDTQVDTNRGARRRGRLLYLALGLDSGEPLAAAFWLIVTLPRLPRLSPAITIAYRAQFGQKEDPDHCLGSSFICFGSGDRKLLDLLLFL